MDRINLQKHLQALASAVNSNYIVTIQEIKQDDRITLDDIVPILFNCMQNITGVNADEIRYSKSRNAERQVMKNVLIWFMRYHLMLPHKTISRVFGKDEHTFSLFSMKAVNNLFASGNPYALSLQKNLIKDYNRAIEIKKQELKSE
jgi:hypothetical protein